MSIFDKVFPKLATTLLNGPFGSPAVLTRTVRTLDPVSNEAKETVTTYNVRVSPPGHYIQGSKRGTRRDLLKSTGSSGNETESSVRQLMMAPGVVVPNVLTDKLAFNGKSVMLVRCEPIMSGVVAAAYILDFEG